MEQLLLIEATRQTLLRQASPTEAIRLCTKSKEIESLCKQDFNVWIDKINEDCKEAKILGDKIDENNAYEYYNNCIKTRIKYDQEFRTDLRRIDEIFEATLDNDLRKLLQLDPTSFEMNKYVYPTMMSIGNISQFKHLLQYYPLTTDFVAINVNGINKLLELGEYDILDRLYTTFANNRAILSARLFIRIIEKYGENNDISKILKHFKERYMRDFGEPFTFP